jgi:uncharacterized protein YjbI with pentapeptide repeats
MRRGLEWGARPRGRPLTRAQVQVLLTLLDLFVLAPLIAITSTKHPDWRGLGVVLAILLVLWVPQGMVALGRGWGFRAAVRVLLWLVVILIIVAYALALWKVPDWLKIRDLHQRYNTRLLVIYVGSAIVVGTGLFFTARTYQLSYRGQVVERFMKGAERLISEDVEVRLAGVYTVARVLYETPMLHNDAFDILVAFIRRRTPATKDIDHPTWMHPVTGSSSMHLPSEPALDVQVAINALAHRPWRSESRPLNLSGLYLRGVDLRSGRLSEANFEDADLSKALLGQAELSKANLSRVNLADADLSSAVLAEAIMYSANLANADLDQANLTDAVAVKANLRQANLLNARLIRTDLEAANLTQARMPQAVVRGADLKDARLDYTWLGRSGRFKGADLRGANGLEPEQLGGSHIDETTRLPENFGNIPLGGRFLHVTHASSEEARDLQIDRGTYIIHYSEVSYDKNRPSSISRAWCPLNLVHGGRISDEIMNEGLVKYVEGLFDGETTRQETTVMRRPDDDERRVLWVKGRRARIVEVTYTLYRNKRPVLMASDISSVPPQPTRTGASE